MLEPKIIPAETKQRAPASEHDQNVLTAARGGGITFAGRIFQNLLTLAFAVIIARVLGAQQYGLYRLTITIVTIVSAVSLLGLNNGIVRYIPRALRDKNKARVWGVIQVGVGLPSLVGLLLTFLVFIFAHQIGEAIFHKPNLGYVLRMVCLSIPFLVLSHSLAAIALGFRKIEYDVYARLFLFEAAKLLLAAIALLIGFGVIGVAAAYIGATVLSFFLLLYFIHKLFSFRHALHKADRPTGELLRFSFPLFLSLLLNQFGRRFETLVLGSFGVLADVGVYSVMLNLSNVGGMAAEGLRKVSNPIISDLHHQRKFADLERYHQTIAKWTFTFNLPIFLTIMLFAKNLLLIFGRDFTAGMAGLVILAAGTLFNASMGNSSVLLAMSGHTRIFFYNSLVYLAVTLLLDFTLIPQWHLLGAAIAGAVTLLLINLLRLVQVYLYVEKILPFNRTFLKPLLAGLVAAALVFVARRFVFTASPLAQLLALGALLWVIYGAVVFLLKLSYEEQLLLDKVLQKLKLKKKPGRRK